MKGNHFGGLLDALDLGEVLFESDEGFVVLLALVAIVLCGWWLAKGFAAVRARLRAANGEAAL